MRLGLREQCLALAAVACVAALLALFQGPPLLRVPIGFLAVLILPGYSITLACLPPHERISWEARVGLAIAVSVGVLTLAVLALDRTPWHLASSALIVMVTSITLAALVIVWIGARGYERPAPGLSASLQAMPIAVGLRPSAQARIALAVLALAVVVVTIILALVTHETATTTDFFVLGKAGDAESYPSTLRVNEPAQIEVGLTNREGVAETYRIELSGDGIEPVRLGPLTVEDGETFRRNVDLRATTPGRDRVIQIALYRADIGDPYRRLQLVVNVDGPE